MSEPDPIPVGLEQLLAYRRKQTMRRTDENIARIRALTASLEEDNRRAAQANAALLEKATRALGDLVTGELGQRVGPRMPGSGGLTRL